MRTSVSARMIWTAAGALLLALVLETPAHGQFDLGVILATLTELNQTMSVTVGGPLAATAATTQQMGAFQQQTMYPTPAIQQALSFAKSLASVMTAAQNLFRTPVNSATLPQTIALEQQLLSANSGNVGSIQSNYTSVYGALPASTAIPADSRIAMDMTDAQAQAAMKKAIALDAIANREEQLSQQMMQQLSSSAPGSGSLISAQAAAWNLQANAYSQGAIAQLLLLESASTAYSGYQMKHMSASHQTANQTVQTILSN